MWFFTVTIFFFTYLAPPVFLWPGADLSSGLGLAEHSSGWPGSVGAQAVKKDLVLAPE